jgi:hypothetical protein
VDPRLPPAIDALMMSALGPTLTKRPTAGQFGAQLRSLRYSLDVTVGDPATELGKIIDTADQVQRESKQMMAQHVGPSGGFDAFEGTEATVIRIRTADAFAMPDKQVGMAKAREDVSLAAEARQHVGTVHAALDQLDRAALHEAVSLALGEIHRTHPAAT